MAFDLYVGPGSRYQAGDWKNIGQQIAEEQGLEYRTVRPKPGFLSGLFKPNPLKAYDLWRQSIETALRAVGSAEALWDDSAELEYATDRPGWEGHIGLVMKFAYLLHPELTQPKVLPSLSVWERDLAVQAVGTEAFDRIHVVQHCDLFVPCDIERLFAVRAFNGAEIAACSLERLNSALWQVCDLWGKDRMRMGSTVTSQPSAEADLDEAALHGLAVYCRMVDEALERRMPLMKDY